MAGDGTNAILAIIMMGFALIYYYCGEEEMISPTRIDSTVDANAACLQMALYGETPSGKCTELADPDELKFAIDVARLRQKMDQEENKR